ncbi:MAG: hypothetical protein HY960_04830 [Ignavibacteriae bacterium]|nr:hypothetical protein [Ignavibacteriota bacterium]
MTTLTIKTSKQKQTVRALISNALEQELNLLEMSLGKTREKIQLFESQYKMPTKRFLSKIKKGFDDSNMDFIEWIGEAKTLEMLNEEYQTLKEIRLS